MKTIIIFFILILKISAFNSKGQINIYNYTKFDDELVNFIIEKSLNQLNVDDSIEIWLVKKDFSKELQSNDFASAIVQQHKEKSFIINISNQITKRDLARILTHECVHIKQFVNKELRQCNKVAMWYMDKIYTVKDDYNTLPYEIEAHKKGNEIYKSIKTELKNY